MGYLLETDKYTKNEKTDRWENEECFTLTAEFYKDHKFITSRRPFTCTKCKIEFNSGVKCIGTYGRVCFKCGMIRIADIKKSIEDLQLYFTGLELEYEKNKNKWTKMGILSVLKQ